MMLSPNNNTFQVNEVFTSVLGYKLKIIVKMFLMVLGKALVIVINYHLKCFLDGCFCATLCLLTSSVTKSAINGRFILTSS